jgi:hypothetical protein
MAAKSGLAVHHGTPSSLLELFDAAARGLVDWSEFDAEVERWGVDVRGLSGDDLSALIEGSAREIPTAALKAAPNSRNESPADTQEGDHQGRCSEVSEEHPE